MQILSAAQAAPVFDTVQVVLSANLPREAFERVERATTASCTVPAGGCPAWNSGFRIIRVASHTVHAGARGSHASDLAAPIARTR